jgi:hypothetical protein
MNWRGRFPEASHPFTMFFVQITKKNGDLIGLMGSFHP